MSSKIEGRANKQRLPAFADPAGSAVKKVDQKTCVLTSGRVIAAFETVSRQRPGKTRQTLAFVRAEARDGHDKRFVVGCFVAHFSALSCDEAPSPPHKSPVLHLLKTSANLISSSRAKRQKTWVARSREVSRPPFHLSERTLAATLNGDNPPRHESFMVRISRILIPAN